MGKGIFYTLGLILGFVVLVFWQMPSGRLELIACDVGQGDGLLIIKDDTQVVVDGGPSEGKILSCLARHIPFYDRQIELVVLTHSDLDHLGGIGAVLERYKVGKFVTGDGVNGNAAVARLRKIIGEQGVSVEAVEQGEEIKVGAEKQIELKVLWPPQVDRERVRAEYLEETQGEKIVQVLGASQVETNERGVVLMLEEQGHQALLMADVGQDVEQKLEEQGLLGDVDYLKVGHHGSRYSTSEEFLKVIKPELAVISVGATNRYGHPTGETLSRLGVARTTIRRTDREGDVVVTIP